MKELRVGPFDTARVPTPVTITLNGVDVKVFAFKPGDVVGLICDERVPREVADLAARHLSTMLPNGVNAIVFPEGINPIVLRQLAAGDPEVY